MLIIARSASQLDAHTLIQWYNRENRWSDGYSYEDLTRFFEEPKAFYALWVPEGKCVSAVRVEPFSDGCLVAGLITDPNHRCKGYATQLLSSVLKHLCERGCTRVYSHVSRHNRASLRVHKVCGFCEILDYAVYLDGSVSRNACTLCKHL